MKKVIICGSRSFSDLAMMRSKLNELLAACKDVVIVSGCARGADMLGEAYAKEMGYPVMRYPALWSKYGRGAGPIRNQQMLDLSDEVICFWDGNSRGSADMIRRARAAGVPVTVVLINQ